MELEDRVNVLEGEIRILKSEIQATLLDIRQQIHEASHRSDSIDIRKDESRIQDLVILPDGMHETNTIQQHDKDVASHPEAPLQSNESLSSNEETIPPWEIFFSEEENALISRLLQDEKPTVGTITLEEFQEISSKPQPSGTSTSSDALDTFVEDTLKAESGKTEQFVPTSSTDDLIIQREKIFNPENRRVISGNNDATGYLKDPTIWMMMTNLLVWVGESVDQIGKDLTTKAIKLQAENESILPEMQQLLLTLVAFSQEASQPKQVSIKTVIERVVSLNSTLHQGEQQIGLNQILAFIEDEKLDF